MYHCPAVTDDRYLDSGSDESTSFTSGSPCGSAPDTIAEPTMSLSHTFTAADSDQRRPPADTAFITGDLTVFYVDEATLIEASNNGFGGVLPLEQKNATQRVVPLSELTSYELHVILQSVYNPILDDFIWKSPICHSTLQIVVQGIDLMPHYGINPRTCIKQYSHLSKYLLTCSPIYPLDIYALAAYHDMEDIAIAASSHMLMLDPSIIDATTVSRIGPSYFRRLNDLHQTRKSILTQLLMTEPALHNLTKRCTFQDQQALRDGWNRGIVKIMKDMKAGVPTSLIRQQILEETTDIHCKDCIKARNARLDAVCTEWSITSVSAFAMMVESLN
ncbi:hypothetical protein VNI00_013554 [Paramarasmius palmivorus]|uniref:BTB/POZ domain-containing protein n=1 Tax=Paramarasmius palmivorus TaxID=297713 RepID=A0AAW0BWC6_9AGAR